MHVFIVLAGVLPFSGRFMWGSAHGLQGLTCWSKARCMWLFWKRNLHSHKSRPVVFLEMNSSTENTVSSCVHLSILCHIVVHGVVGSLTMRWQQYHHFPVVFGFIRQRRWAWTKICIWFKRYLCHLPLVKPPWIHPCNINRYKNNEVGQNAIMNISVPTFISCVAFCSCVTYLWHSRERSW